MAADDPTRVWRLLGDGRIVGLTRTTFAVRIPDLAAALAPGETDVLVELHGVTELEMFQTARDLGWEERPTDDPAAIERGAFSLADVFARDDDAIGIDGPHGRLRLTWAGLTLAVGGRPLTVDELEQAVAARWTAWRAGDHPGLHPLISRALVEPWTDALAADLLAAWQTERTSDLAATLAILDGDPRDPPARVDGPDDVARWTETWAHDPTAAIAELQRLARTTFYREPPEGVALRDHLDACSAADARAFTAIARCIAAVAGAPPDPRIGRALEALLESSSDHWFRVDQVAHVIGPFGAPHDEPSFADHLLPLLAHHGDASAADRLAHRAQTTAIECDCNGAEMSERLVALAAALRARYPDDRPLPADAAQSLRMRRLIGPA